ncbi:MAG: hypothetical protein PHD95_01060 [Candidatus ainarchaeum sp.]|nr:hypothetical protein [Candidatus ainarchaeum sp.]
MAFHRPRPKRIGTKNLRLRTTPPLEIRKIPITKMGMIIGEQPGFVPPEESLDQRFSDDAKEYPRWASLRDPQKGRGGLWPFWMDRRSELHNYAEPDKQKNALKRKPKAK